MADAPLCKVLSDSQDGLSLRFHVLWLIGCRLVGPLDVMVGHLIMYPEKLMPAAGSCGRSGLGTLLVLNTSADSSGSHL